MRGPSGEDDIPKPGAAAGAANDDHIPMLASGGFGDARGLVGRWRWAARASTWGRAHGDQEARIHDNVKKALVDSDERSTSLIFRTCAHQPRLWQLRCQKAIEMEHEGKTSRRSARSSPAPRAAWSTRPATWARRLSAGT